MNRIQLACYALLASAFILGAMVIMKASVYVDNLAYGEMVVNRGTVTLLATALNNRNNEELLYVLDSRNERLMAYGLDPTRNRLELLAVYNVAEDIQRGIADDGGGEARRMSR
jgi:hypothetical protein